MLQILQAETAEHIRQARELFQEYGASLSFNLCFQSFDQELARLPGEYAPPAGRLLLAQWEGKLAGCGALHQLENDVCEMKRLYVRPEFRGKRLGLELAQRLIDEARQSGYSRMRLDTIAGQMDDAIRMYRRLGFQEIAPYRPNPIPGALYMELELAAAHKER